MKKIIAASLISLGLASSAFAATTPAKTTIPSLSPLDGFYLGAGAGYQSTDASVKNNYDGSHSSADLDGGLGDLTLGYGKALSKSFYLGGGLRYDYYGDVDSSKSFSNTGIGLNQQQTNKVQLNDALFATIMPGVLVTPKTLLYANLGIGIVNMEGSVKYSTAIPGTFQANNEDETKDVVSGIAGIGVRQAFSQHISMSAEVDHVAPNSGDLPPGVSDLDYNEGLVNFIYTFK